MHTSLQDAIDGQPWSVAAVLRDLELVLDDEGRPLSERRAPSVVKQGVPMVLKACPYNDERKGVAMNVSALAQITRHMDDVLHDVAVFRAGSRDEPPSWKRVLAAVVDQLAGPALHLLLAHDARGRVPARRAVGHKLAAGFFGVARSLVAKEALGEVHPVTVTSFLRVVREQKALIGASEACAGPPNLIERATRVLLHGDPAVTELPEAGRCVLAEVLTGQIVIGVAWELFDRAEAAALLLREPGRERMSARNDYMAGVLDRQLEALQEEGSLEPAGIDFGRLLPPSAGELASRMGADGQAQQPASLEAAARAIEELYAYGEGAVSLRDGSLPAAVARRMVRYLDVLRSIQALLWQQERCLRRTLDYPLEVPMKLEVTVMPSPRALSIYEAILGHRLRCEPGVSPQAVLRNHRRQVVLPWGAA